MVQTAAGVWETARSEPSQLPARRALPGRPVRDVRLLVGVRTPPGRPPGSVPVAPAAGPAWTPSPPDAGSPAEGDCAVRTHLTKAGCRSGPLSTGRKAFPGRGAGSAPWAQRWRLRQVPGSEGTRAQLTSRAGSWHSSGTGGGGRWWVFGCQPPAQSLRRPDDSPGDAAVLVASGRRSPPAPALLSVPRRGCSPAGHYLQRLRHLAVWCGLTWGCRASHQLWTSGDRPTFSGLRQGKGRSPSSCQTHRQRRPRPHSGSSTALATEPLLAGAL